MDINLTDTQFFIGLLITIILLFLGIYAYLVSKSKDTSGVIPLEKVDIKAYHNKQTIKLTLDGKFLSNYFLDGFHPIIHIIDINGIKYDFFYYQGDDFCSLYRTNSKGIYECKRINVNFK